MKNTLLLECLFASSSAPTSCSSTTTLFFPGLALFIIFASFILRGYYVHLRSPINGKKLPPGSLGLPFLGETLQFAYLNTCPIGTPPPFLQARLTRYGMVFKTHFFGRPTVVSMDPDLNKLLLSSEEKLVHVYFPSFICKIVGPILTAHGVRHQMFRNFAAPLLSLATVQARHLIPVQEHALAMLRPWACMHQVDAQWESRKFVFKYMVKSFLGLEADDPKTDMLMRDFMLLMGGYSAVPLDFPGTTFNKVLKARRRIMSIIKSLVQVRRKELQFVKTPNNLVDISLKEADEDCSRLMTDQEIADIIFFLMLGGFETTSFCLTNVIKYLSENGHVVEELRKEHMGIWSSKGENSWLTADDYRQMHFTSLVVKEALRMASIVHYVTRESLSDIVFKGIVIPKGWMVLMNFSMVHLSPDHFRDPLKFDPWRWEDGKCNAVTNLMAFGGGKRSCLGAALAKLEVSIFIHYLVKLYSWERESQGIHDDTVSSLSFPTMRNGLHIKVKPLTCV